MNHPFMDIPIPAPPPFSWERAREVPIEECGEEMVPASLVPEKILVRPQYYLNMFERAVPECYVRRSVLERLLEAADMLPNGCRLVRSIPGAREASRRPSSRSFAPSSGRGCLC